MENIITVGDIINDLKGEKRYRVVSISQHYAVLCQMDIPAGRKILCKRYSTKVKNGAGKQGEFWPGSLDHRKPCRPERYARRHGVNAGLAAVAY